MTSPQDSTHQKLSFTRDNRHQYLETAMVSASEAEREMMEAEARGRERRVQDMVRKRRLQNIGSSLVVVVILGGIAGLVYWLV
jgi:hypothetical protein